MLQWYREVVARAVGPLKDDPAVIGWAVTNEPQYALLVNAANVAKTASFRVWLRDRYKTVDKLKLAWGQPGLTGFEQVQQPQQAAFETQSTPAARDFLKFEGAILAQALVARANSSRRLIATT